MLKFNLLRKNNVIHLEQTKISPRAAELIELAKKVGMPTPQEEAAMDAALETELERHVKNPLIARAAVVRSGGNGNRGEVTHHQQMATGMLEALRNKKASEKK